MQYLLLFKAYFSSYMFIVCTVSIEVFQNAEKTEGSMWILRFTLSQDFSFGKLIQVGHRQQDSNFIGFTSSLFLHPKKSNFFTLKNRIRQTNPFHAALRECKEKSNYSNMNDHFGHPKQSHNRKYQTIQPKQPII